MNNREKNLLVVTIQQSDLTNLEAPLAFISINSFQEHYLDKI